MGTGWRRFLEAIYQKWQPAGIAGARTGSTGFTPTANERNEKMMQEATRFARYVRTVEMHLNKMSKDVKVFSTHVKDLLQSELPRQYTVGSDGQALATGEPPELMGAGVNVERVTGAAQMLELRMREEVHSALSEWIGAYERAKALMKHVEGLRLELDSRRRQVTGLSQRARVMKSDLESTVEVPLHNLTGQQLERQSLAIQRKELSVNAAVSKLDHKRDKRDATKIEFREKEVECMQAMRALLKDATNLRDFVAQSFKILHETSFEAYKCFPEAESHWSPTNPWATASSPPAAHGGAYPHAVPSGAGPSAGSMGSPRRIAKRTWDSQSAV